MALDEYCRKVKTPEITPLAHSRARIACAGHGEDAIIELEALVKEGYHAQAGGDWSGRLPTTRFALSRDSKRSWTGCDPWRMVNARGSWHVPTSPNPTSTVLGRAPPAEDPSRKSSSLVRASRAPISARRARPPLCPQSRSPVGVLTTVETTLNNMPQLVPSRKSTSIEFGFGEATANLRGRDSPRTLVLVDGRRLVAAREDGVPT